MALNGLFCADVPLRNYSLTRPPAYRVSRDKTLRAQKAIVSS